MNCFLSWPQPVQNSLEWWASSIWLVFMELLREKPQGFPGLFFLSSLCRKRCGQGVLASSEVSASPVRRSITSIKFRPNSYEVLWSFLPLGYCYAFSLSCPLLTFYYIMPRLFVIVTQKADMSHLSQAELSLLSYSQLLLAVWTWSCS